MPTSPIIHKVVGTSAIAKDINTSIMNVVQSISHILPVIKCELALRLNPNRRK